MIVKAEHPSSFPSQPPPRLPSEDGPCHCYNHTFLPIQDQTYRREPCNNAQISIFEQNPLNWQLIGETRAQSSDQWNDYLLTWQPPPSSSPVWQASSSGFPAPPRSFLWLWLRTPRSPSAGRVDCSRPTGTPPRLLALASSDHQHIWPESQLNVWNNIILEQLISNDKKCNLKLTKWDISTLFNLVLPGKSRIVTWPPPLHFFHSCPLSSDQLGGHPTGAPYNQHSSGLS